jgi:hypothetical protein
MWSANGQEIFYLSQDHSTLFAAAVATQGGTLRVSRRDRLFRAPRVAGRGYPYDASEDGNRFLVVVSPRPHLSLSWPTGHPHLKTENDAGTASGLEQFIISSA